MNVFFEYLIYSETKRILFLIFSLGFAAIAFIAASCPATYDVYLMRVLIGIFFSTLTLVNVYGLLREYYDYLSYIPLSLRKMIELDKEGVP